MSAPAASAMLALGSVAVFVGSLIAAWATFDFWETGPLLTCVVTAGLLAALAVYAQRRRLVGAVMRGLVVTFLTFMGTFFVTLARWEG